MLEDEIVCQDLQCGKTITGVFLGDCKALQKIKTFLCPIRDLLFMSFSSLVQFVHDLFNILNDLPMTCL